MGKQRIFMLVIVLLLAVSFSFAETNEDKGVISEELEQKTRPANKEDVVGEWQMIWQLNAGSIPTDNPFVAPYYKFYFSDNNGMATMGSEEPFNEIAATIWRLAKENFQTTYNFVKPGVLLVKSQTDPQYYIIVSLVTEDLTNIVRPGAPKLKKGDLILSYPDDNGVYLVRYLSRVLSK